MLFQEPINSLSDWGKVFQRIEAFEPLIQSIFRENYMDPRTVDHCAPGSNAVFRAGDCIVKIFAPEESQIGGESDYLTEKHGLERANRLQIPAPKIYASGVIRDKYIFRYLLLESINGTSLSDVSNTLTEERRFEIGKDLRAIVHRMDVPCAPFNSHTLFGNAAENRWSSFPASFQKERQAYLAKRPLSNKVYVHGDLNPDNILLDEDGQIHLIDFADALLAPIELELAAVVCDGFRFNPAYLRGFLGRLDKDLLADQLLYGLLIHDYGVNIIRDTIAKPDAIHSLPDLKNSLLSKL